MRRVCVNLKVMTFAAADKHRHRAGCSAAGRNAAQLPPCCRPLLQMSLLHLLCRALHLHMAAGSTATAAAVAPAAAAATAAAAAAAAATAAAATTRSHLDVSVNASVFVHILQPQQHILHHCGNGHLVKALVW